MIFFTLEVHYEQDVVQARQRTRELAEQLEFGVQDQARLATAVSEIARNAFQYAQGGTIEFCLQGNPQTLLIRVQDQGQGIPHLAEVLQGRYSSQAVMGHGIAGTRRLMDIFEVESLPGKGTTVVMGKTLPKRISPLTEAQLQQIRETVLKRSPQNPYDEIQHQNQELLRAMAELRKREEELTQLNRELEDTNRGVVALYAELDEKASSLQKVNELKTHFLSNMSHEFRTPLNSILSLSRMLLSRIDGELNPEQEKQVIFIQKAANGLSELVNDLLDLAKVEAGKIEVRPNFFEVNDLFGTLRGMLRPLLVQGTAVTLIFEETDGLPQLYSDEAKVAQILRNFVSNALKFTEQGEIRVTARQTGESITFSVSDTGLGIDPEDQARIFEDFVQIESHLQQRVKGTGLGLPLSRKLAELLGGNIWVESQLGQGSTFSAAIPIGDPNATAQPPELDSRLKDQSLKVIAPIKPACLPIIAVEDHPETLLIYEKYLQESRYQLIPTRNLAEARQALEQVHPAAIILDVLLEGQNSWAFLRELKSDAATRTIPILVITVIDNEKQALAIGADGFLAKPVDPSTLLNKLNRLTSPHQGQKILIIDDDPTDRYVVKQELAGTPVGILEAANGPDGLALAAREQPDVILLDLKMPNMNGFDVLEQLKSHGITQSIPVIIHSSTQLDTEVQSHLITQGIATLSKAATAQSHGTSLLRDMLVKTGLVLED